MFKKRSVVSGSLETRIWVIAISQILDTAFSDHPDILSRPSRNRCVESFGKSIFNSHLVKGLAYLGISSLGIGMVQRKHKNVGRVINGTVHSYPVANVIRETAKLFQTNESIRMPRHEKKLVRADTKNLVMRLMTMDAQSLPVGAVTYATFGDDPLKKVDILGGKLLKALAIAVPGINVFKEVATLDGNLIFYEPSQYLGRSKHIAQEFLTLAPVELSAASIVFGAAAKGVDVEKAWKFVYQGIVDNPSAKKKAWVGGVFRFLGLK